MKKKEFITLLKVYTASWFLFMATMIFLLVRNGNTVQKSIEFLSERVFRSSFLIVIHVFFVLCYLLFLCFRYLLRTYRKYGIKTTLLRAGLRFVLPVIALVLLLKFWVHRNTSEAYSYFWDKTIENNTNIATDLYGADGKHRGMSVFGWRDSNTEAIAELVKNNVEWVAVIPFLDQEGEQTPVMRVPSEVGAWSRRDSIFITTIGQLQKQDLHVQLKPHLWLSDGWRSNVHHATAKGWDNWFASYRLNMLHYATMAAETKVELFCIGTELKSSIRVQPQAWKSLIAEIKEIYNGKLTYAANWDGEYNDIQFWDELDYIGIQAYFPLTKVAYPSLAQIKTGWNRHLIKLDTLYATYKKPILFTEVGYKSEPSATIKPWEWNSALNILTHKKSDKTQQLAFEALYQTLWHKEWFAGTYIWEWDTRTTKNSTWQQLNFSPRFKPAQNTIAKWYGVKTTP